ncbi:hypothetical protein PSEUBRA_004853 [Kalmanozyma brasiliensis GHG001]|uniref:uncharacterized protein n=1 Tax=Kalmanozyma brasiliensis (strain GHG001) TaxID=1365824 RepID=UPI002867D5B0|nr:uncharacterized protein PSEUBRA_004853 [Kalmanozyma brasiliensis GHG001]KAF6767440.1 hypothetical protein PSEUBRA_004853 [Kalmanozyma brasiliensis GHG001]
MRLLHVIILFTLLTLVLAPPLPRWELFDWPSDAERLLHLDFPRRFGVSYTEAQADEVLSNALLYLQRRSPGGYGLVRASFMPRHRFLTHGIDEQDASRRARASWFSVPLLTSPDATGRPDFARVPLPGGGSAHSLDLVRFDRFQPKANTGFWVPTAIIRPHFETGPQRRLVFSIVHQYPTSPVMFRDAFLANPKPAQRGLKKVLQQKQDVWLAKLPTDDRNMVQTMWSRAPYSGLMQSSTFFDDAERRRMRSLRRVGRPREEEVTVERASSPEEGSSGEDAVPPARVESMRADKLGKSRSGREQQDAVSPSSDAAGASTSGSTGERQPVEHNFFSSGREADHIRPQPFDGWNHVPVRQRLLEASRGEESELNLELALGRPPFGARRGP